MPAYTKDVLSPAEALNLAPEIGRHPSAKVWVYRYAHAVEPWRLSIATHAQPEAFVVRNQRLRKCEGFLDIFNRQDRHAGSYGAHDGQRHHAGVCRGAGDRLEAAGDFDGAGFRRIAAYEAFALQRFQVALDMGVSAPTIADQRGCTGRSQTRARMPHCCCIRLARSSARVPSRLQKFPSALLISEPCRLVVVITRRAAGSTFSM